jgi:inosose dehydratase
MTYAKEKATPLNLGQCLREARSAGYEAVEVGGGEAILGAPAHFLKLTRDNGLQISAYASSVTYNSWPPNIKTYQADMRYAAEVGVKIMMICGGFSHYGRRNQYAADYEIFGGNLGKAMNFAHKLGLEIAYHPHRGCIVETGDETALLLKRLPKLKLCLDIAHLEASGDDAVKFINRFGKKIISTHIKDYDIKKNVFTELGRGNTRLDVGKCVAALEKVGYQGWLCVELDKTFRTPLESAKISRSYLKKHGF